MTTTASRSPYKIPISDVPNEHHLHVLICLICTAINNIKIVLKHQKQCALINSFNFIASENLLERVWQSKTPNNTLSFFAIRQ